MSLFDDPSPPVPPGSRSGQAPAHSPTTMTMTGKVKGASLLPLVANPDAGAGRQVLTTIDPGNHALSTSGWRYIRYHTGEEELYDIMRDPHEWHNLAGAESTREKLEEMRRRLRDELARLAAP